MKIQLNMPGTFHIIFKGFSLNYLSGSDSSNINREFSQSDLSKFKVEDITANLGSSRLNKEIFPTASKRSSALIVRFPSG